MDELKVCAPKLRHINYATSSFLLTSSEPPRPCDHSCTFPDSFLGLLWRLSETVSVVRWVAHEISVSKLGLQRRNTYGVFQAAGVWAPLQRFSLRSLRRFWTAVSFKVPPSESEVRSLWRGNYLINVGSSLALPVRGSIFILDLELEAILHQQETTLNESTVTKAEWGDSPSRKGEDTALNRGLHGMPSGIPRWD